MGLNGRKCGPDCGCGVHPVVAAAAAMLDQCEEFIRTIPSDAYAVESRALKGGTIGKHIRHTLDHYRAALAACTGTIIDYDRRERDVPMETDPEAALRAIDDLKRAVEGLKRSDLASPVKIRVMVSGDGTEVELGSTLARELAFASHHAVHHHAMLGAIAEEVGVSVSQDFGKAPSTLSYERGTR